MTVLIFCISENAIDKVKNDSMPITIAACSDYKRAFYERSRHIYTLVKSVILSYKLIGIIQGRDCLARRSLPNAFMDYANMPS